MRFGPYEVVRHLGTGGMSTAWLARGPASELVVLKQQIDAVQDEQLREEARVGTRLRHPGVVQTLDVLEHEGRPVLVLEYVAGASLVALRKKGPLPMAAVCRIGADIAEALTSLHDAYDEGGRPLRIIHRDVTPANIIVAHDGKARLIDLGIARSAESRTERTDTGSVRGTLRYLAPELFDGHPPTPSTDLWSLGVCLFEAVLGRPAVTGPQAAILAAIVRGSLLNLRTNEHIAPALHDVIGRLCAREDQRFPHARVAARRLTSADPGDGAMLTAIAVYATIDQPPTAVTVAETRAPASAPDAFADMAALTYCGEDDDVDPFADLAQAPTVSIPMMASLLPAPVMALDVAAAPAIRDASWDDIPGPITGDPLLVTDTAPLPPSPLTGPTGGDASDLDDLRRQSMGAPILTVIVVVALAAAAALYFSR